MKKSSSKKEVRLQEIGRLHRQRKEETLFLPDPEPETVHEAEKEDFEDFSDLGERDLVTAFSDLTRNGRKTR